MCVNTHVCVCVREHTCMRVCVLVITHVYDHDCGDAFVVMCGRGFVVMCGHAWFVGSFILQECSDPFLPSMNIGA